MVDREDMYMDSSDELSSVEQEQNGIWRPLSFFQKLFMLNRSKYPGDFPAESFFTSKKFSLTRLQSGLFMTSMMTSCPETSPNARYNQQNVWALPVGPEGVQAIDVPDLTHSMKSDYSPKDIISILHAQYVEPVRIFRRDGFSWLGLKVVREKEGETEESKQLQESEVLGSEDITFLEEVKEGPTYAESIRRASAPPVKPAKPMAVETEKEKKEEKLPKETPKESLVGTYDSLEFVDFLESLNVPINEVSHRVWDLYDDTFVVWTSINCELLNGKVPLRAYDQSMTQSSGAKTWMVSLEELRDLVLKDDHRSQTLRAYDYNGRLALLICI